MAEPIFVTGNIEYGTFDWLRREVAIKLGYNADARLLDRSQRAYVDSIIESGVMQFASGVSPAMAPDREPSGEGRAEGQTQIEQEKEARQRAPHRWSFLNYVHTIQTVIGQSEYDLPDDFGSFIGEPTTSREGGRIAIVREAHLRQLIASSPATGKPAYCAMTRVSVGGEDRARVKLVLYPAPDAVETLSVEYGVVPESFSATRQHLPGGREHAETVLAFCFYVAAMRTGEGLEMASSHVRDRMVASIVLDRAAAKPTADGVWVDDDGKFNHRYLMRYIGRHLGYGPNPKAWSHQQTQMCTEALRRTLRRVYNPALLPGESYPHDWSFLRPRATLALVAGQHTYDLPADFASLYGPMTHATEGSTLYPAIIYCGEEMIRQLLQRQESSARPDRAAIRVKSHDRAHGTRYEILFWPVPDQNYQIDFRYRINPDTINLANPSESEIEIHGTDRFSELFLEAAMLTADEMMGVRRSVHEERYIRALAAAVGSDRVTNSPDSLGYNSDTGQVRRFSGDHHEYDENIVTYNGVAY